METMNFGFLIVSFILQILVLLMLILNTNYMTSRLGETLYKRIHADEKIFMGIGITCLLISLIVNGLNFYYIRKSDVNIAEKGLISSYNVNNTTSL